MTREADWPEASLQAWIDGCADGTALRRPLGWMIACAERCDAHAEAKRFIEAYADAMPEWDVVASNMDYFLSECLDDEHEGFFRAAWREVCWEREPKAEGSDQ